MPPRHDDSSDDGDDFNAFRAALKQAGVRKITSNRADPGRKPLSRDEQARLAARRAAASEASTDSLGTPSRTTDGQVEPVTPSQLLDFAVPDLPYRQRQRLKRGEIAWEAGLDLHGYTLEQARSELESFIDDAIARRSRCVLVVHGKAWTGMADHPIIKSHVNAWLRQWPDVLAFTSALELDGGSGAVYVLLRSKGRDPLMD
ncbi:DNA mismatch repair protein MutS [Cobetia marina]|jgi:DNA-nicking Smr family endonuclease|uniref:Smr/MutS family protein n=1 Tax=Cobetia marina TaxID=28258 RepID=A0ABU9GGV0_COBMA|nr:MULTISPECIES: Smr/MutS family protein [Cobetia]MDA5562124.1 Smr/MutS family protein [Cobetia sp. MMG027]MDH2372323.1 Smr/MutS family protein [Cobetia sp. 3AK]MDI6002066.1 Smr/MutS family protein [Cobetia pacifica]MDN2655181.1 Smr/MutS family protein [Cobetia sp. 14N.309.X.WAT.E.A4]MDO6787943.1 Smr/MutS family protein [Cobetia marina]